MKCASGLNGASHQQSTVDIVRQLFAYTSTGDVSVAKRLNDYIGGLTQGKNLLSQDPVRLATLLQQWLAALHGFIDGDGRVSRFVQELVLHASGLPMPVMDDFWDDTQTKLENYVQKIKSGIATHINVLNQCTHYVKCMKEKDSGFLASSILSSASSAEARACIVIANRAAFAYADRKS